MMRGRRIGAGDMCALAHHLPSRRGQQLSPRVARQPACMFVAGMLGGCRVTRTAKGIQGRGSPTAGPGTSGFLAGPSRLPP
jgi:hypothetical protein